MRKLPKSIPVLAVLGILLFLAGDLYRSFGFLICTAGALMLLCAFLLGLRWLSRHDDEKIRKITGGVKVITFVLLAAFLISFVWVEGSILAHDSGTESPDAPTVIVLGAGLNGDQPSLTLVARLQTALEYLQIHPQAAIIVSGGQGTYETCTEAAAMARWLTEKGVDPSRIYLEEQSTDTKENLVFSRKLMKEYGLAEPVIVVSNSFHLYRARLLAQQAGFSQVQTLSAPIPKVPLRWLSVSVYLREYCSVMLLFLRSAI